MLCNYHVLSIQGMKSIRVKLMRQIKEESERFRALKAQKDKEINQLKQQVSGGMELFCCSGFVNLLFRPVEVAPIMETILFLFSFIDTFWIEFCWSKVLSDILNFNNNRSNYHHRNYRRCHYLPFNAHEWPRQNFSLQYPYNINQTSDENKEKFQFGNNLLIQY